MDAERVDHYRRAVEHDKHAHRHPGRPNRHSGSARLAGKPHSDDRRCGHRAQAYTDTGNNAASQQDAEIGARKRSDGAAGDKADACNNENDLMP